MEQDYDPIPLGHHKIDETEADAISSTGHEDTEAGRVFIQRACHCLAVLRWSIISAENPYKDRLRLSRRRLCGYDSKASR